MSRKVTICFVLFVGLAILGFLSYRYLAPFGKVVYYRFTSKLPGAEEVTNFSLGEDSVLKIPSQIIRTEQSKLSLKLLSKDVESIKAVLKFKKGPKEIKLGTRGNEKDNFLYRPLYHSFFQDLNWPKIEDDGFILWQREKKYQSLYNFVNNPPPDKKTAAYFVDQDKLLLLKPAEIKEGKVTITTSLRASHTFLIRVDKKPLVLKVAKQDMNVYDGQDKLKISVLKGQTILVEKTIEDDGITDKSGLKAEPQEEIITLEKIGSGIYQVNLNLQSEGGDSLITKIEINQSKVIFKNRIFFLGSRPTNIWTNVKNLNIHTAHTLQTVKLDNKYDLKIQEVAKLHSFDLEALVGEKETGKLYKLESPKNDLIFEGDGYFAFSEDAFFYPEILKSVDLNTLDDLQDIDYVLSSLPQAKKDGDWLVAETSFDPKDIKIEGDKLYFSLEAPELAKYGGELEIDYLEIAVKNKGILELKASPEPTKQETGKPTPSESKRFFPNLGQIFKNLFNQLGQFFTNLLKQPPSSKTTPTPTPLPTPTTIPTPTSTPTPINIKVSVLNGGAVIGTAAKFAEVLKKAGFSSVIATNADNLNYKNATLRFRSDDKSTAEKIAELLKTDYPIIEKKEIATTSAEIVVILGSK